MNYGVRVYFSVGGERVSFLCGHGHGGLVSAVDCAEEYCLAGGAVKFESILEGVPMNVSRETLATIGGLLRPRGIVAVGYAE